MNNDVLSILSYTLNKDSSNGDFLVSPVVAYFCFESLDFNFEKVSLNEDIFSDARKEKKAASRNKISEITGTVYKLSTEQKRCLKYLKKKYGKDLVKEIKEYRKNTLAPYQVAKTYMNKTKSLYPKELYGMTKEEYLRYKKSAEDKILNMRSNKYSDLEKELMNTNRKYDRLNNLEDFVGVHDLSDSALNKVFKKYGFYSTRFTDAEMREYQRKLDNIDKIKKDIIKAANDNKLPENKMKELEDAIQASKDYKKEMSQKNTEDSNFKEYKEITRSIENLDIPDDAKDSIKNVLDIASDSGIKLTTKSFEDEYENFLTREKIKKDIKNRKDSKYVDDYKRALQDVKTSLDDNRQYTLSKMAKERDSKTLNDMEKKIYELKPGMRKDSDRLSDYTLKLKESDFFEPKFYNKSEKFRDSERKIDAEIKRFERSLEAKMSEKDFQLLRKYRLISNLMTIKNVNINDLYSNKDTNEGEGEDK